MTFILAAFDTVFQWHLFSQSGKQLAAIVDSHDNSLPISAKSHCQDLGTLAVHAVQLDLAPAAGALKLHELSAAELQSRWVRSARLDPNLHGWDPDGIVDYPNRLDRHNRHYLPTAPNIPTVPTVPTIHDFDPGSSSLKLILQRWSEPLDVDSGRCSIRLDSFWPRIYSMIWRSMSSQV